MLKLLKYTPQELAEYIKDKDCKVYIYGAGMIGKIVIPDFFIRFCIEKNLQCYIDSDKRKQGSSIKVKDRAVPICSMDSVKQWNDKCLIIITNSNFSPVLSMLDSLEYLNNIETAVFPVIQTLEINKIKQKERFFIKDYFTEEIPKIIHYCWFSGNPIPDYLNQCIQSWHEQCPDYEIVRWDENNYDISGNPYVKRAYEAGKWAFAADYARLEILYNNGGFYIDTDVQLLKSLDILRKQGAFCGVEKWGNINTGGCCGAVKHHIMLKEMLKYRKTIPFKYDDGTLNLETNGLYETVPFIQLGMRVDNSIQRINGMTVFSSDFFHPYDYMSGQTVITENTFSIHHFHGGWLDEKSRNARKKTAEQYNKVIYRMIKKENTTCSLN